MTEDDKFALKEFFRGVAFTIGIVGVAIIGIAMLSGGEDETLMKPHAEVVDTYKGCDIVRWNSHQFAEYKYFLYCENQ
jgi:hypothetical protein